MKIPLRRQHAAETGMAGDTIEIWHQVAKDKDLSGLSALLADEVVFHSPVVHTPQVGKAVTFKYLSAAFQVLFNPSFHYVREIRASNEAALEFAVEIDGIALNGVDLIQWNDDGKITDFKVMIRPLKAVNLIHQKMGEMLHNEKRDRA